MDRVPWGPFPDAEKVMMTLLTPIAPTVTSAPDPVVPPLIRIQRVGGADDGITDNPRIEVSVYGSSRPEAWDLAEQIRQVVLISTCTVVEGALIDKATTDTPARQIPYESADIRRVTETFRLAMRRPIP